MRTLKELLENEIEGVVIATPSALHASQTVTVLNRRAAAFCQMLWIYRALSNFSLSIGSSLFT
jgi:hypothetical protein